MDSFKDVMPQIFGFTRGHSHSFHITIKNAPLTSVEKNPKNRPVLGLVAICIFIVPGFFQYRNLIRSWSGPPPRPRIKARRIRPTMVMIFLHTLLVRYIDGPKRIEGIILHSSKTKFSFTINRNSEHIKIQNKYYFLGLQKATAPSLRTECGMSQQQRLGQDLRHVYLAALVKVVDFFIIPEDFVDVFSSSRGIQYFCHYMVDFQGSWVAKLDCGLVVRVMLTKGNWFVRQISSEYTAASVVDDDVIGVWC